MHNSFKKERGLYKKQFNIEKNEANATFLQNKYVPGKCASSNFVCFSLTDGAIQCKPENSINIGYNAEGNMNKMNKK